MERKFSSRHLYLGAMKKLLLPVLLCASACTSSDTEPTHAAVTAYLRQHANDPASYEAVSWSPSAAFTRRDSLKAVLEPIMKTDYAAAQGGFVDKVLASPGFKDTARVGTRLTHAYRGKNKLGATVLDSAQFVVYNNGQVQAL